MTDGGRPPDQDPGPPEPAASPPPAPPVPGLPRPPEGRESEAIPWSSDFLWPEGRYDTADANPEQPVVPLQRAVLGLTFLVALSLLILSGRAPRSGRVPAELVGTWSTPTAPYARRDFRISIESIAFDQGDGRAARYPIRRVERDQAGALDRYRIIYQAEGGDAQVDLEYDPGARTLRMASRPRIIWRRR